MRSESGRYQVRLSDALFTFPHCGMIPEGGARRRAPPDLSRFLSRKTDDSGALRNILGDPRLRHHNGTLANIDLRSDTRLTGQYRALADNSAAGEPVCAASTARSPIMQLWAMWTRLSIMTDLPICVMPSVPRSIVHPAPVRLPLPISTEPTCGSNTGPSV